MKDSLGQIHSHLKIICWSSIITLTSSLFTTLQTHLFEFILLLNFHNTVYFGLLDRLIVIKFLGAHSLQKTVSLLMDKLTPWSATTKVREWTFIFQLIFMVGETLIGELKRKNKTGKTQLDYLKLLRKIIRKLSVYYQFNLIVSWRRSLSYKNQSIYLQSKSMNWFLYDGTPSWKS